MKAELSNQKEDNEDIENGICCILDLVYTRLTQKATLRLYRES